MSLAKAVGRNSPNSNADVLKVQELLNKARQHYRRFSEATKPLVIDGICGPASIGAIEAFQRNVMHYVVIDGVVEPNRNTWKKLNGNSSSKKVLSGSASLQKPALENFVQWFTGVSNTGIPTLHKAFREENDKLLGIKPPLMSSRETRSVASFAQTDSRWAKETLGSGTKGTFRAYGCAVVSLTMAATYLGSRTAHWPKDLEPSRLDPLKVNSIFKKAGVFTAKSYSIHIVMGAKALGMKGTDSGAYKKILRSQVQSINTCIRDGGLVMLHVDYKNTDVGDHWILLTEKGANGEYTAIDPAYGKEITLGETPENGTASNNVLLYGRSNANAKNAANYKVVRFITLTSA